MSITVVDLNQISEAFETLADVICERWDGNDEPSPDLIKKALLQLFDILNENDLGKYSQSNQSLKATEINELGEYGLTLLQEMATFAADSGLNQVAEQTEDLSFPFAIWLSRQNCEIKNIEPIVNALSRKAQQITEPLHLKQLFTYTGEIIECMSPRISQDLDKNNPARPWRILVLNRALIATRTHDLDVIKLAFDALIEQLPDDAPRFFEEGVEQMHQLSYPEQVKDMIQQYYLLHGTPRTLH